MASPWICDCICHEGEEPCSPPCCVLCVCGLRIANDWKVYHEQRCEIFLQVRLRIGKLTADITDEDIKRICEENRKITKVFGEDPVRGD
jgi:hypothetical protein